MLKKVLLVGNSPRLLGSGLGKVIDHYNTVVRFNNYEIAGYEEDVGKKTHVLARRACDDVHLHPCDNFKSVLCFVTYCRYTPAMEVVAHHLETSGVYRHKLKIVPASFCKKIGEDIGLDQPREHASIGALTVGYYNHYGYLIDICGFDFLRSNKHYFSKQPKDAKYHNSDLEEQYIRSIVKVIDE